MSLVTHHGEDLQGDHEDDNDDYNTPNTSEVDGTTVTTHSSADKQATSTLRLRQKGK